MEQLKRKKGLIMRISSENNYKSADLTFIIAKGSDNFWKDSWKRNII
jgi:hypothetical protein